MRGFNTQKGDLAKYGRTRLRQEINRQTGWYYKTVPESTVVTVTAVLLGSIIALAVFSDINSGMGR